MKLKRFFSFVWSLCCVFALLLGLTVGLMGLFFLPFLVGTLAWKIAILAGGDNSTALNIALGCGAICLIVMNLIPGMRDKNGKEYF